MGSSLAKPALTFGQGAVSLLAALGTIAALVVLSLLEGPKLPTALPGLLHPDRPFRAGHSLTAGIVTLIVFMDTQVENHVLNPVVMSRTANVNPLLVLVSVLVGTTIGQWLGGTCGAFVAALVAIPLAGALQVIVRVLWQATSWEEG